MRHRFQLPPGKLRTLSPFPGGSIFSYTFPTLRVSYRAEPPKKAKQCNFHPLTALPSTSAAKLVRLFVCVLGSGPAKGFELLKTGLKQSAGPLEDPYLTPPLLTYFLTHPTGITFSFNCSPRKLRTLSPFLGGKPQTGGKPQATNSPHPTHYMRKPATRCKKPRRVSPATARSQTSPAQR